VKTPWRQRILASLPATATFRRIVSYDELDEALAEAAQKRRMHPDEYAMRAVRAFVEHDLDIDDELREIEPNLRDIRRVGLPPKRYRGKEFGRWRIERLAE
jgi:hypothetical protein